MNWVCDMAEELTCAVMAQMAGIRLTRREGAAPADKQMDIVYGYLEGEKTLQLQFAAEPSLFYRMAQNIIGEEPEDEEEVREYAAEFANVLCGRFVSEICRTVKTAARFRPTVYGVKPTDEDEEPLQTIRFLSDRQEEVSFSWSKETMNGLLKREMAMKHNIMVVDDSRVVYAEMKKMLAESEYEIISFCRSGEEALSTYGSVQPELVTMDIVMPGKDGLDTSEELIAQWPEAKIVVVSSLAYGDTTERAKAFGAKGFLFKPFSREELIEALDKAFEESEK